MLLHSGPSAPSTLISMALRGRHLLVALCLLACFMLVQCDAGAEQQHNLVLFIGDGMGMNHIQLARLIEYGDTGEVLSFEALDHWTTC
ncbi:hypothetical protein KIPB_003761 [Kipferlia bialata]|uniref:Alkaline phosphatase n=1 Tax=Kipferlia bialata TaxID=797122 RepID=A0A9K3CU85_9EUKA|nr:hypothetical protein KIPB_003761 [Kipferlia bialata]|eukprot:g3761.t1